MIRICFERLIEWDWPDAPARNPILHGDIPPRPEPLPKFLTDHDAAVLMAAARAHRLPRYRIVIEILARTGLRASELCDLAADAVTKIGDAHWLRVPVGKLRNDRFIPLHPDLVELLAAWTADQLRPHPRPAADSSPTGTHRSTGAPSTASSPPSPHAPASDHVHPHQLRHTLATQAINRGMRLEAIAALLGHRSMEMTLTYARIADRVVADEYAVGLHPDRRPLQHRRPTTRHAPRRHRDRRHDPAPHRSPRPHARQRPLHPPRRARVPHGIRLRDLRLLQDRTRLRPRPAPPTRPRPRPPPTRPRRPLRRPPRPHHRHRPLTPITRITPARCRCRSVPEADEIRLGDAAAQRRSRHLRREARPQPQPRPAGGRCRRRHRMTLRSTRPQSVPAPVPPHRSALGHHRLPLLPAARRPSVAPGWRHLFSHPSWIGPPTRQARARAVGHGHVDLELVILVRVAGGDEVLDTLLDEEDLYAGGRLAQYPLALRGRAGVVAVVSPGRSDHLYRPVPLDGPALILDRRSAAAGRGPARGHRQGRYCYCYRDEGPGRRHAPPTMLLAFEFRVGLRSRYSADHERYASSAGLCHHRRCSTGRFYLRVRRVSPNTGKWARSPRGSIAPCLSRSSSWVRAIGTYRHVLRSRQPHGDVLTWFRVEIVGEGLTAACSTESLNGDDGLDLDSETKSSEGTRVESVRLNAAMICDATARPSIGGTLLPIWRKPCHFVV